MCIQYMFGMCQLPDQAMYWSSNPMLHNSAVADVMRKGRMQKLSQYFHLNNEKAVPRGEPDYDPLFKVRPLLTEVLDISRACYNPGQDISIDEAMIKFNGRLSFKQFVKGAARATPGVSQVTEEDQVTRASPESCGDPRRGDHECGDPRRGDHECGDPRRGDHTCDDPRRGDPRRGDHKCDDPRCDELGCEDSRCDDLRRGDPRCGDARYGDTKHGDPLHCHPGRQDTQCGDPRFDDPRHSDPLFGDPSCDDQRRKDRKRGEPGCGEPECHDPMCDHPKCDDPDSVSPSLDYNSNASHRSPTKSRTIAADSAGQESVSEEEGERSSWLTTGEVMMTVVVVAVAVLCALLLCLSQTWGSMATSPDSNWARIHTLGGLVVQVMAVVMCTAAVLLMLQSQLSRRQLREWVARVFQLELKENTRLDHSPPLSRADSKHQRPGSVGDGDGDKNLNHNEREQQRQHQQHHQRHRQQWQPQREQQRQSDGEEDDQTAPAISPEVGEEPCDPEREETKTESARVGDAAPASRGRNCRAAMKDMYRKFLLIRRKYKAEMHSLHKADRASRQVLSRIQLTLPVLEKEKQALLAELEAIDKQHQEEKRRNHDLLTRLNRLNHHLLRVGHTVQPPRTTATPTTQPPPDRIHPYHNQHHDQHHQQSLPTYQQQQQQLQQRQQQ